jgi:hypothetical protein
MEQVHGIHSEKKENTCVKEETDGENQKKTSGNVWME